MMTKSFSTQIYWELNHFQMNCHTQSTTLIRQKKLHFDWHPCKMSIFFRLSFLIIYMENPSLSNEFYPSLLLISIITEDVRWLCSIHFAATIQRYDSTCGRLFLFFHFQYNMKLHIYLEHTNTQRVLFYASHIFWNFHVNPSS